MPGSEDTDQRDRFRDWPAPARYVVYGGVVVLVLAVIGAVAGAVVVRRPLPETSGTIDVPGLHSRVTVYRDEHGVPQIYADTPDDLFRAQGFVEAQDRFWQMDERRHAASGRMAELVGREGLAGDLVARTLGFRDVAATSYRALSDDTQNALASFSDGVNAWLDQHSGGDASLEYTLLSLSTDYQPASWTPIDSLAWSTAMAWNLSGDLQDEVARANLSAGLEPDQVAALYPAYPTKAHPPIVPGTSSPASHGRPAPHLDHDAQRALAAAGEAADRSPDLVGKGDGLGSNSWVVSGRFTTTGKPLLANDPHLATGLPGMLYPIGLHCRTVGASCPYDVSGFTYAGLPGVMIGHDQQVAWGMTDLRADDTDLYLEKVTGASALHDGQLEPLSQHDERIAVAGGPTKVLTVRSTRHGPLLSDVSRELSSAGANAPVPDGSPDRGTGYAVAVGWQGLRPSRSMDAVLALDRATDWTTFRAAAAQLTSPATDLVYADQEGHIGYQATGSVPVRPAGLTGQYPTPGWLGADDPTGSTVPFDQLPSVLDPASGMIVAANQEPTADATPRVVDVPDQGYRSARIIQLLRAGTRDGAKLRVADMTRIQADTRNPMAPILVPYLLDVRFRSNYERGAQRLLASWDYSQPAGSPSAAYFNAVWRNLLARAFHHRMRQPLWPDGGSRWMAVVAGLLDRPDDIWWDDPTTKKVEHRDDVLSGAMQDARTELVRRQAREPSGWTWGHQHQISLHNNDFGGLGGALLSRGERGAPGGVGSVAATGWDAGSDGYDVTTSPAMRMVVDLNDLDRSRWVDATGASGHAFSSNYDDQLPLMLAGRTLPWYSSANAVRRSAEETLTLK